MSSGAQVVSTIVNENASQRVLSGTLSVSAIIKSRGSQHVLGTVSGTTIYNGGVQLVSAGGIVDNTIIYGVQSLTAGSTDTNAVIMSGGLQSINNAGARVNNTIISSCGTQSILNGRVSYAYLEGGKQILSGSYAVAAGTVINAGGEQLISNGSALDAIINLNGTQNVYKYAAYTSINAGGVQNVNSGGSAKAAEVYDGGVQNINLEGLAEAAKVFNGGIQNIQSGSAGGTELKGGTQNVYEAGIATFTVVSIGGIQNVHSGGNTLNTILSSGGKQNVLAGGIASSAIISSGGTQNVSNGGITSGTAIYQGGEQNINSGAAAEGTTIYGGNMRLDASGEAGSLAAYYGGTAYITGTHILSGDNSLNAGGKITLVRADTATPAVLTVENLLGNGGIISMNVSFSNPSESDKIIITGTHSEGNIFLRLKNTDGSVEIEGDSLKLVEYSGGASADGTFSFKGGKWDKSWYSYTLEQGDSNGVGNDYYLRSTKEVTPISKTAIAAPSIANVAVNVALNSLQKRLGDLRNMGNGNVQHGTWARGYYQSLTLKDKVETEMKVSGIEAGYDFRLSGTDSSNGEGAYLGIMAGKTSVSGINGKSKTGTQESKGEGEGILGGAYLTYIGGSGFFADFTARAGTNKLDLSAYSVSEDEWLNFSPERTFVAASMEAGKRLSFDGFQVEPKAELQYMNICGTDVLVEGLDDKIKFGGATYLTAIGTLGISYSWKDKKGLITEPYAEVSYSQDLSGEETLEYYGHKEKTDMKGSSMEGRIGLNMQLTENLYWHAAASIESGKKQESFGADAGIRYMFGGKADKEKQNTAGTHGVNKTELPEAADADPGNPITELNKENYLEACKNAKTKGNAVEILIPSAGILFKTGNSEVLEYYQPMLDAFAELYKQTDGNSEVLVEGYSSNGSNEEIKNPKLSEQRAEAVKQYLVRQGIPAEKIHIKSYGSSKTGESIFKTDPNCKGGQCYRRVNISIK